ncbi:MAG: 6,7-dimethyl-8-ribityllumazine synthase [Longimicrobiales bacterium]
MVEIEGSTRGEGRRFLIIVARFNELITDTLLDGARSALIQHGVAEDDVVVARVPGAFEIPGTAGVALRYGRYDGIVALGCVIRGETPHFDYVAGEAARGVQALSAAHDVPITFGVLTTDTREQALARAGGEKGNKGWEAALAALEMVGVYQRLEDRAGPE